MNICCSLHLSSFLNHALAISGSAKSRLHLKKYESYHIQLDTRQAYDIVDAKVANKHIQFSFKNTMVIPLSPLLEVGSGSPVLLMPLQENDIIWILN